MDSSLVISAHLEIVEIKCETVDKRVLKVLKYLSTFNIRNILHFLYISEIFFSLHTREM